MTNPVEENPSATGREVEDSKLDALLKRIQQRAAAGEKGPSQKPAAETPQRDGGGFVPIEPASFAAAGLTDSQVEALVVKFLLFRGDAVGRDIADQVKLPFALVDELLRYMKNDRLVVHKGSGPLNDYQYQLTDLGRERALSYSAHCTYFGAAPVAIDDYVASVAAQSLTGYHPTDADLRRAFEGLLVSPRMLDRLGPAMNSGRGMFLFGSPGNGKTSIAERITRAFGTTIWIPRALGIDGEILRLFDPVNHVEVPLEAGKGLLEQRRIDKRWVRIRRPSIVAGGELTMASLEVAVSSTSGIGESPLQLKSNCGTLVIDDFGRQRMSIADLLNRWIVPLETRCDYLNLPNGKKVKVPFDQLIIFSTNLEPRELVDEAFLRRIPYKIEVVDPSEEEFCDLFAMMAPKLGVEYRREPVDYLVRTHYLKAGRPFRFCQPRDLLLQVRNYCVYHKRPPELTCEYLDLAVENYFAVM